MLAAFAQSIHRHVIERGHHKIDASLVQQRWKQRGHLARLSHLDYGGPILDHETVLGREARLLRFRQKDHGVGLAVLESRFRRSPHRIGSAGSYPRE